MIIRFNKLDNQKRNHEPGRDRHPFVYLKPFCDFENCVNKESNRNCETYTCEIVSKQEPGEKVHSTNGKLLNRSNNQCFVDSRNLHHRWHRAV